MKVLVTGADGFVGQWLCHALLDAGHQVTGTYFGTGPLRGTLEDPERARIRWCPLDLTDDHSVAAVAAEPCDRVVHLAGLASASEAARDPGLAWIVNAVGTARLAHHLAAASRDVLLLLVSTGEVYGAGEARPRRESDPVAPRSAYAASKAAAELAAEEVARRTGLRIIVARPFPHTGPGQGRTFAFPSFAARIADARRAGGRAVAVGNLDPVRDLLDVRDVADAYLALLDRGQAGVTYNVARGEGVAVGEVFRRLAVILGADVTPEQDPALARAADIPHLVGDPTRLIAATGWKPRRTIDETLQDLVDAQAD